MRPAGALMCLWDLDSNGVQAVAFVAFYGTIQFRIFLCLH